MLKEKGLGGGGGVFARLENRPGMLGGTRVAGRVGIGLGGWGEALVARKAGMGRNGAREAGMGRNGDRETGMGRDGAREAGI